MLIYRQNGDWTCGYFSGRDGGGPAWIRSDNLRIVKYNPRPGLSAWTGTWTGGEDRVSIRFGERPGTLRAKGNAQWHGAGDDTHLGDMDGSGKPNGNRLRIVEGESDGCTVDMTLLGPYIVASDNMGCGGMNVRFEGIWKRVKP